MKKARTPAQAQNLEQIPNIGKRMADDCRTLGIRTPAALKGKDPYALYAGLCRKSGVTHDPCVLDTFIAAVYFMDGKGSKPWWSFTAARKRTLNARARR